MKLIFDVECYKNYFLVMFMNTDNGNVKYFEMRNDIGLDNGDRMRLKKLMMRNTVIGFNSLNYDIAIVRGAVGGCSNAQLKGMSDDIIVNREMVWNLEKKYKMANIEIDNVDLMQIAPGMAGLKIYGGRINAPKMQDLPIEPSATISDNDASDLRKYCINDLELTHLLYKKLIKQVDLRRQMSKKYGIDLMAKSDAQIAEAVFKCELSGQGVEAVKTVIPVGTTFKYDVPDFIEFWSPEFQTVLDKVRDTKFEITKATSGNSNVLLLPKELSTVFEYDGTKFKLGMGGLHSQEKKQTIICEPGYTLVDKDVTSYYPFIILNQGLYPKHLTSRFLNVYRSIVDRRLVAKSTGDKTTADSLKITINGSFGKFGSQYSTLYSPQLLVQTTMTGQLCLMMLIERLVAVGVMICSANTDGIVMYYPNDLEDDVQEVCFDWELDTNFNLEDTFYKAVYSRDVNNYIAIGTDDSVKGKGIFAVDNLQKNPAAVVCQKAVIDHVVNGTPIEEYILSIRDVSQFVSIRTVAGGASYDGEVIGKSVRWYYGTSSIGSLVYTKNGNKVAKSDGAVPMMELSEELPSDLDYAWYIEEANKTLKSLGL